MFNGLTGCYSLLATSADEEVARYFILFGRPDVTVVVVDATALERNLDRGFRRVGAYGKQALTMMMGFGCNAAGVISSRVIDSPRERLLAIITNNLALCNGSGRRRSCSQPCPSQASFRRISRDSYRPSRSSWLLSKTLLRGEVFSFSLELPPYRPPRILRTIYTSIICRTIFVLDSLSDTMRVPEAGGWTMPTGVCVMLFSLIQNPCSTTLYTIYKETGSAEWTAVSALLPLLLGFVVTFFVAQARRFIETF